MEFGLVDIKDLGSIDYSLPPDTPLTKKVLAAAVHSGKPKVYIGCAKWGRKEWVGSLYPKGTSEKNFLDHYVKHFNSIELNATHYKIYNADVIGKWAEKAGGKDFLFSPKVSQEISHFSDLTGPEAARKTDRFLEGIVAFKGHLGPVFLQVSDKFSPARKENLYSYLESLPGDIPFFVELRHPLWFADKAIREEWLSKLKALGMGAVITDASGRRDCVHMELTIPKAFIRFVGNGLHPTDYTRIDEWAQRLRSWFDQGLQELYFFMHQHDETYSPVLCDYVIEQVNKHCGTTLSRVEFLDKAKGGLF